MKDPDEALARDQRIAARWSRLADPAFAHWEYRHSQSQPNDSYIDAVKAHSMHDGKLGFPQQLSLETAILKRLRRSPLAELTGDPIKRVVFDVTKLGTIYMDIIYDKQRENTFSSLVENVVKEAASLDIRPYQRIIEGAPVRTEEGFEIRGGTMQSIAASANRLMQLAAKTKPSPLPPGDYEIRPSDFGIISKSK